LPLTATTPRKLYTRLSEIVEEQDRTRRFLRDSADLDTQACDDHATLGRLHKHAGRVYTRQLLWHARQLLWHCNCGQAVKRHGLWRGQRCLR